LANGSLKCSEEAIDSSSEGSEYDYGESSDDCEGTDDVSTGFYDDEFGKGEDLYGRVEEHPSLRDSDDSFLWLCSDPIWGLDGDRSGQMDQFESYLFGPTSQDEATLDSWSDWVRKESPDFKPS
jgi:hypothetical protein